MMKFLYLLVGSLVLISSQSSAAGLTDLADSPYATAVNALVAQEIVQGYSDNTFRPDQPINRAEFTKLLIHAAFDQSTVAGSHCFTDVSDEWFAPSVCTAKAQAIIEGYPDGSFKPANTINYAEAAKIVLKTFDLPEPQYFQAPDNWYDPYVDGVASSGGTPRDGILPADLLSRGEMAQMIYLLNKTESTDSALEVSPLYVVTTPHPGEEVTGGYINSYKQWQQAKFAPSINNYTTTQAEVQSLASDVLASVNDKRVGAGKSVMRFDQDLQDLAQNFAAHLVINGIYSHSDKLGRDPFERAEEAGITGFVAESIVWGNRDPLNAIDWWQKSVVHWNNVSNSRFVRAGVGIATEPDGGYIVVLLQGE